MDLPARPDDALAHPTRAQLFRVLGELRRPASTGELAARLGLHPNGIRLHLARLHDAGLLTRERARQPRGRPRDVWAVAPGARPGGEPPRAYAQLVRWLARAMSSGSSSLRRIEATGRAIGRELAPAGHGTPEEALATALVSLGFQPCRAPAPDGGVVFRLGNCPYCDAVRESPEVVCGLHRGITRGLLDVIAPASRLAAFVPGPDPDQAGCLIELRGELTSGAAPAPTRPSPRPRGPTRPERSTPIRGRRS